LTEPVAGQVLSPATGRTVLLLSLACCASMMSQRICDAMLPELARQFDSTLAATSQVVSVFSVCYGLAQLFYGPMGDRYGKLGVVVYTTIGCGLGSLLAVAAGSLQALVLARMLAALFAAAIIPMSLAWTGDAVPYERRQETLARVGLGTTLGNFTGQLLGGVLTDTVGWRWAFAVLSVFFLVVAVLLYQDWTGQRKASSAAEAAAPTAGMVVQILMLLQDRWVRKILILSVVEGAAGFGIMAIVASHLHLQHAVSLSMAGAVVALVGLGGVFYMVLARHVIHRLGEHGMALTGGLAMALAMLVAAWSASWQLTAAFMLMGGFCFFMLHNTIQTLATQMAPNSRGLGVSIFASALFLGQALGVLFASLLIPHWGSSAVIGVGAAMMASVGVALHRQLLRRRAGRTV
jgi:predicted MFS family arabinose efflux permease